MKISKATLKNLEEIIKFSISHFQKANQFFGNKIYNTEYEIYKKTISKYLTSNSKFKYYIVQENNKILGIALIYLSKNQISISMIEGINEEVKKTLIQFIKQLALDKNIKNIEIETFPYENSILKNLGASTKLIEKHLLAIN